MKYLIELKPLAPYFFGGENTFRIGSKDNPYYIRSLEIPPQTSFIGTLRYMLLDCSGKLNASGKYADSSEIEALIGKDSYQPGKPLQSFGKIKSVSPMFLTDNNNDKYVRLPLNHRHKSPEYTPLNISCNAADTSHGSICLPTDFDAKHTVDMEYVRISDGKIIGGDIPISKSADAEKQPLFRRHEQVGIDINKSDKAFFKREFVILHPNFRFAWYAEIDDVFANDKKVDLCESPMLCCMGRDKSPFEMSFKADNGNIAAEAEGLPCSETQFYYALSDLIPNEPISYDNKGFAMIKPSASRPLASKLKSGQIHLEKGKRQLQTICAGSVFYWDSRNIDELFKPDGFGYNVLIELGGKNK